jgi:cytochrome c
LRDDPFGVLVKYGYTLFTDTANQIGPTAADSAKRFAGNNLACGNCHLRGGSRPYAMPVVGLWGQFPQYRAREGAVDTLEDRINGCMERSMNGRALPLDSREMKAFSSYVRWLSTGVPDGAKLVGAGTLQINEPARAADGGRGAQAFAQTCAPCHGVDGLGRRAATGAGYQFPPLWGPDSFNNGAGMSRLFVAHQVDVEDLVPARGTRLVDLLVFADAGIVDEDVKAPELSRGTVDEVEACGLGTNVSLREGDLGAGGLEARPPCAGRARRPGRRMPRWHPRQRNA